MLGSSRRSKVTRRRRDTTQCTYFAHFFISLSHRSNFKPGLGTCIQLETCPPRTLNTRSWLQLNSIKLYLYLLCQMYTSLEATSPTGPIRTREHPLPRKTRVLWIFHTFIMFSQWGRVGLSLTTTVQCSILLSIMPLCSILQSRRQFYTYTEKDKYSATTCLLMF